ncbi:MAG: hypothetical protein A2915_03855 [Candidatus Yanofskybacteria bacterium RIFCSPLOWO2_01_FULL_41_34]|nr:MAG: hypothetical protein A2915_03855 [Candidatus Yanofskybacteria bacterium RIFCSPLOWO2_01_FULL_41_34]
MNNQNQSDLSNMVKNTPFETLAEKIKTENRIRDYHIRALEKIMTAYSYVICVLESNCRTLTKEEVNAVFKFIHEIVYPKNKKTEDATKNDYCFYRVDYYIDSFVWAYCSFFKESNEASRRFGSDKTIGKSPYWKEWRDQRPESKKPLTSYHLQEDLWDSETQSIRYGRLPDFVKNYPWAFPPNVVELHRELVEMKTKATA